MWLNAWRMTITFLIGFCFFYVSFFFLPTCFGYMYVSAGGGEKGKKSRDLKEGCRIDLCRLIRKEELAVRVVSRQVAIDFPWVYLSGKEGRA